MAKIKAPTLTEAQIDRLAHKTHVLDISRDKAADLRKPPLGLEAPNGGFSMGHALYKVFLPANRTK